MRNASYSKPTQRQIDRAETDILIALSQLTQRKFAELSGWHESKVSRMNWRDVATAFCILKMAAEVSPLGQVVREVFKVIGQKKSSAATEDFEPLTMSF
ncbi:CII family transcriptional regulator [Plesiomonas shigelloides]|uniref:CII family transcriptional regulator n=1 Tax=Plesiomonas shigelloides TaxID=703 RepID=UPI000A119E7C|nr:CII family transcriptional regulator [Plesiomonas shigelloides]